MKIPSNAIYGWHFVADTNPPRLAHTDPPVLIEVGKVNRIKGQTELCCVGLHASIRAIDALAYAESALCCRVAVWGSVQRGDDKICGLNRAVVAMADCTNELHEFACVCAENALRVAKVTDKRSWEAIAAKRKWLKREINDDQLAAARAAVRAIRPSVCG